MPLVGLTDLLIWVKWVPFVNAPFELASIWHNLKSRRPYICVHPFTDLNVMQGLLVFSFREACHPMLETRQPKTFFIGSSPFRVFTRTYTINTENILRHIFSSRVIGEDSEPLYTYLRYGSCTILKHHVR